MAMLEIKDLEVFYGVIQAIKGISFEVNEGEVVVFPAPFAPISATTSPSFTSKEIPLMA